MLSWIRLRIRLINNKHNKVTQKNHTVGLRGVTAHPHHGVVDKDFYINNADSSPSASNRTSRWVFWTFFFTWRCQNDFFLIDSKKKSLKVILYSHATWQVPKEIIFIVFLNSFRVTISMEFILMCVTACGESIT